MQRALITGVSGQDGQYLARLLVARKIAVAGFDRRSVSIPGVTTTVADITDADALRAAVQSFEPDACFHLAAYHRSSASVAKASDEELEYLRNNLLATHALLAILRDTRPRCRVFLAGSSHMFGRVDSEMQNERTPFSPNSAYGITKVAAWEFARLYRERRELGCSMGILYNHESPLRDDSFITARIARTAVAIARKQSEALVIGNLDSRVDWGFAGDYVEAMVSIVEHDVADDFIVASGELHTVREFVEIAFARVKLDWQNHISEKPDVHRPVHTGVYHGDISKIRATLGWQPKTSFRELVEMMVDHYLARP